MNQNNLTINSNDPFDLDRFLRAQEMVYDRVLTELLCGQKRTHWMWYIFPQFYGLGNSSASNQFAIKSREEAQAYLQHPILGERLLECTEIVLDIEGRSVSTIFGFPDDIKFRSCMTLFAAVSEPDSVFNQAIEKFFKGQCDLKTLELIGVVR